MESCSICYRYFFPSLPLSSYFLTPKITQIEAAVHYAQLAWPSSWKEIKISQNSFSLFFSFLLSFFFYIYISNFLFPPLSFLFEMIAQIQMDDVQEQWRWLSILIRFDWWFSFYLFFFNFFSLNIHSFFLWRCFLFCFFFLF